MIRLSQLPLHSALNGEAFAARMALFGLCVHENPLPIPEPECDGDLEAITLLVSIAQRHNAMDYVTREKLRASR